MTGDKKRKGSFGLNMDFEEALERFAQTNPNEAASEPATSKRSGDNALAGNVPTKPATPVQGVLDLGIEVQKDINGIEMGVLENGIPYLTQRGLAEISGVPRSVLQDITREWEESHGQEVFGKDRISYLRTKLLEQGFDEPRLYIETKKDGSKHYAYPDIVCMAILEYYAFEAGRVRPESVQNFRRFATYGLQRFIYEALNYTPADKWRYHQDRVSILKDASPDGYYIIFNEMAGLIVDLIVAGLTVNDKTIPDISVGVAWGKHWEENGLGAIYGERIKTPHNYPDYFPQAASNPQPVRAYPDESLPEFRRWFRHEYLPTKFPPYILKKANVLAGGKQEAERIAAMYDPKRIEG